MCRSSGDHPYRGPAKAERVERQIIPIMRSAAFKKLSGWRLISIIITAINISSGRASPFRPAIHAQDLPHGPRF
jgi:hypothetical protein